MITPQLLGPLDQGVLVVVSVVDPGHHLALGRGHLREVDQGRFQEVPFDLHHDQDQELLKVEVGPGQNLDRAPDPEAGQRGQLGQGKQQIMKKVTIDQ